ncbi:transporter substrate-binding domain-containing protein [Niveispirillum sp. BGYR6]|uniref:substrate-binding periplasmic protein n=1 Tax=Niveispirillum sp. BGYR6 TaxID=2971249 RepID=UPI0022B98338|nr:transporter substrate-binding domain-containing protein [Niveispirillum sp. BGYR6]MDG5493820.1 transporter substrate-binding domain-containing protein [Niveispirillum sp. BGYR6]
MRGWIGAMLLGMAVVCGSPACARQGNLIMAYGDFNEPPYAWVNDGGLAGGFLHELGLALAEILDRDPQFRHLPRNRLGPELVSGNIDLYCLASAGQEPGFTESAFSTPLFIEQDIIVLSRHFNSPPTLAGLAGKRVGSVLGAVYPPMLEGLFNNSSLIREDARSDTANLRKLAGGRLDAVVLSATAWRQATQANPALAETAQTETLGLPPVSRACLVSPAGTVTVAAVNSALQTLRDNGTLAAMVQRLGPDATAAQADQAAEGPGINPANRQYR